MERKKTRGTPSCFQVPGPSSHPSGSSLGYAPCHSKGSHGEPGKAEKAVCQQGHEPESKQKKSEKHLSGYRNLRDFQIFLDFQTSQNEGQEDQGLVKELGCPPICFKVPWASWPSFWLILELHQTVGTNASPRFSLWPGNTVLERLLPSLSRSQLYGSFFLLCRTMCVGHLCS